MIVKVQQPLYPPDGPWLAYNEDRTVHLSFAPPADLVEKMGNRVKAYFEFDIIGCVFHQIVEDQPW